MRNSRVTIQGINITDITSRELNDEIRALIHSGRKEQILNVNIHSMNIAYKTPWYRDMLNDAYINFCDGDGVRLGAKLLGFEIVEKITYNRWIWDLARFSEESNFSWYLLGGKKGIVEECSEILNQKYPNLNIVGTHHGFLNDQNLNDFVLNDICEKKPNILIIGMGMPLQEKWLKKNIDNLEFNIALTGGAVFDYVSGNFKMTPDIFYKLKMEWFYRFLQEPKRLFKRYFIGNPLFMWRVFLEKLGLIKF